MAALPNTFKLERYFDKYEFSTKYLMCCSDAEPLSMKELLDMADDECKEMWENLKLSYTHAKGHPLLREEAAKLHNVSAEDILIITPQEGIYIAMKTLVNYLKSGNDNKAIHAISTFPAYQSLYENLRTAGCKMDYWTTKETDNGWDFDLAELQAMITGDTKLLVVNFPHNPTGYIPPKEKWEQLISLCKQHGIFIFCDEMYRLSNNDDAQPLQPVSDLYQDSITLFGMSKTFAMPGLRIGWLSTKNKDIMNMMSSFKDYITICAPAPTEILSIIGLRNYHRLLNHTLGIIKTNLELLDKFFAKHSDLFVWCRPKACTTAFVRLKGWLLKIGPGGASAFCDKLVREKQVLLAPGTMFDHVDEYVRVGFARRDLVSCLTVLEEFLSENKP